MPIPLTPEEKEFFELIQDRKTLLIRGSYRGTSAAFICWVKPIEESNRLEAEPIAMLLRPGDLKHCRNKEGDKLIGRSDG